MFSCYTYPLAKIIHSHGISSHFYADDNQQWVPFKFNDGSLLEALERLECCICEVRGWLTKNKLKLNDDKTEFLILRSPTQRHHRLQDVKLKVGSSLIAPSPKARNLGVIFDSGLTFHDHISKIVSLGFFHLRSIASIKKYVPTNSLAILVHAFISSRIDFCNSILYGLPLYEIQRLQKLHNQAARLLTNTRRGEHITPVLSKLHWLPVQQRVHFKLLTFAHKSVNNTAPEYLHLPQRTQMRCTRSSTAPTLLRKNAKKRSAGDRAYSVAAPQLWNALPSTVRTCQNLNKFHTNIKTILFQEAFGR